VSLVYDTRDNRLRPTRGSSLVLGGDIAGLGGSVKYARLTANASKYVPLGHGFIFSLRGEGGAIKALGSRSNDPSIDDVRLTDRFFLGEPQIRGFDIRGVGPACCASSIPYDQQTGAVARFRPIATSGSMTRWAASITTLPTPKSRFRWARARVRWGCGLRSSLTRAPCLVWRIHRQRGQERCCISIT
jgi:outer membrane protein assembly factor BamA